MIVPRTCSRTRALRPGTCTWAIAILVSVGGCTVGDTSPTAPAELTSVSVPSGFDFATTRSLTLHVEPGAALSIASALLEVRLPSGGVLYQGPVPGPTAHGLALPIPTAVDSLVVAVRSPELTTQLTVPVDGATALVRLEP